MSRSETALEKLAMARQAQAYGDKEFKEEYVRLARAGSPPELLDRLVRLNRELEDVTAAARYVWAELLDLGANEKDLGLLLGTARAKQRGLYWIAELEEAAAGR